MTTKSAIIDALETMRQHETSNRAPFKARAYAKVISQLKGYAGELTLDQLEQLPGVGKRIRDKIAELLDTGHLAAAEKVKHDPAAAAVKELLLVHGIGPVKAKALVAKGIMSVAALEKHLDELNDSQRQGVKYFAPLQERIPRSEMVEHQQLLQKHLGSKQWRADIMGSFRRNAPDSGDIDQLMTWVGEEGGGEGSAEAQFVAYIELLKSTGYIIATLANGPKKFMGIVQLNTGKGKGQGKPRRLDLMLAKPAEYPYALLYFTGSDKYNIRMRAVARAKGYTMNEHGMVPLKSEPPAPFMQDEEAVMAFLNMPYVPPHQR